MEVNNVLKAGVVKNVLNEEKGVNFFINNTIITQMVKSRKGMKCL